MSSSCSSLPSLAPNDTVMSFSTTKAEGRVARQARKDREQRMRMTLANRQEGHHRPAHEMRSVNPIAPIAGVGETVLNADRLKTNCGAEVNAVTAAGKQRRENKWDKLRGIRAEKEKKKWDNQHSAETKDLARCEKMAGSSIRNSGSVRYNLINHMHPNANHAAVAKYKDDMTQYHAVCRSQDLYNKDNRAGFNIITGEARRRDLHPNMSRPVAPQ